LIGQKKITPIIAIFIDPWDRKENVNRRETQFIPAEDGICKFCEFIVDELIPTVEPAYSKGGGRKSRAILGTSYGGLHAAFMAMRYGSVFDFVAMQSGAFRRALWILDGIAKAEILPSKAFLHIGTFEPGGLESNRKLRDILKKKGVTVQYLEVPEGHSWGHWRAYLDDILIFFYGTR
jgi:enterochelin esterase family protein